MTEQTQEERREERKKKRLAEKEAAKGTPVPPKPTTKTRLLCQSIN